MKKRKKENKGQERGEKNFKTGTERRGEKTWQNKTKAERGMKKIQKWEG
jgi:hypothetical protein